MPSPDDNWIADPRKNPLSPNYMKPGVDWFKEGGYDPIQHSNPSTAGSKKLDSLKAPPKETLPMNFFLGVASVTWLAVISLPLAIEAGMKLGLKEDLRIKWPKTLTEEKVANHYMGKGSLQLFSPDLEERSRWGIPDGSNRPTSLREYFLFSLALSYTNRNETKYISNADRGWDMNYPAGFFPESFCKECHFLAQAITLAEFNADRGSLSSFTLMEFHDFAEFYQKFVRSTDAADFKQSLPEVPDDIIGKNLIQFKDSAKEVDLLCKILQDFINKQNLSQSDGSYKSALISAIMRDPVARKAIIELGEVLSSNMTLIQAMSFSYVDRLMNTELQFARSRRKSVVKRESQIHQWVANLSERSDPYYYNQKDESFLSNYFVDATFKPDINSKENGAAGTNRLVREYKVATFADYENTELPIGELTKQYKSDGWKTVGLLSVLTSLSLTYLCSRRLREALHGGE